MHPIAARFRFLLAVALAASFVVVVQSGRPASARQMNVEQFMTGLACIESSGRYTARNNFSGAYGKYQIMPRNWTVWAGRFLRDRAAQPTPENQEIVARAKIERLHDKRGSWRRVAYWWLTGNSIADESRWTAKARRYVNRVMAIAERAATPRLASRVPARCAPRLPEGFTAAGVLEVVAVRARAVYVRRGPGVDNRATAIVRRGDELRVLDRTQLSSGRVWIHVQRPNGRLGWVAGWLTRPVR